MIIIHVTFEERIYWGKQKSVYHANNKLKGIQRFRT